MRFFKIRERPCGITIRMWDTDEGPVNIEDFKYKYPRCDKPINNGNEEELQIKQEGFKTTICL